MANLRSKNDRAIAAYLTPIAVAVDSAVSVYTTNTADNATTRRVPLIDVLTSQGSEDPLCSGNHFLNVRVRVEYSAANQPEDTNPQSHRVALDAMTDAVFDALHLTDNGCDYKATAVAITEAGNALATGGDAANNADMADYTCMMFKGVEYVGGPDDSDSGNFVELIKFQVYAAALGGLN